MQRKRILNITGLQYLACRRGSATVSANGCCGKLFLIFENFILKPGSLEDEKSDY